MLTLSTDTLEHYGLNRIFKIAKDAGFEGLDLVVSKNMDTKDPEYLKELVEKYELPIISLQTDAATNKKEAIEMLHVAKESGIPLVIFYPPPLMDFQFIQWMKSELPLLQKRNELIVAMVNAPSTSLLGFLPERAMNSFQSLNRFGAIALDLSSLATQRMDIIRVFNHFKKDIVTIFISNYHKGLTHMPLAEGVLPLESLLTKLKQNKFRGNLSVRLRSQLFAGKKVAEVVKKLVETREYIAKYFLSA